MSVLFEKLSAAEIEKRLQELKGQQEAAELDVAGREAALEGVLASGGNGDKAIDEIGKARTRVATLKAVLGKGAVELQAARDREERAAEMKTLAELERRAAKALASIRAKGSALIEAAKGMGAPIAEFDLSVSAMIDIQDGSNLRIFNVPLYPERDPICASIRKGLGSNNLAEAVAGRVAHEIAAAEALHEQLGVAIARRRAELTSADVAQKEGV